MKKKTFREGDYEIELHSALYDHLGAVPFSECLRVYRWVTIMEPLLEAEAEAVLKQWPDEAQHASTPGMALCREVKIRAELPWPEAERALDQICPEWQINLLLSSPSGHGGD